jgi:predicted nucleotidyltransferase
MRWTQYSDIDTLLEDLLGQMREILGDRLVGLYLYGSLVSGDFDPHISDIDLLAATATDLTEDEFARLHKMHDDFAAKHPEWYDRVEVAYLSVRGLKTFREERSPISVISPGEPFNLKDAGADWLVNWWVVRENGVALYGPPASEVIAPIASGEFFQVVQDHARHWPTWVHDLRHPKAQAYAILTMCRAQYAIEHGEQPSKQQAAAWAQARWPEWAALIEQALVWRVAPEAVLPDGEESFAETEAFVTFVAAEIGEWRVPDATG